jgi:putative transposase
MRKFEARPGYAVQAYRFALDPNAIQEQALRSHCGAARAAFNWAVGWVTASWSQRAAEQSYRIPEKELTQWRPWSLPELRKEFNRIKRSDPRFSSWWPENSKEAYNTGLAGAAAAFKNYADSRNGDRKGPRVGPPRPKSKHKARLSCRFTTGTIRVEPSRRHVTLPRIGTMRTHESTRKLERRLTAGTARILSGTVRHERGRWFVSFQVEVERVPGSPAQPETACGVDLGISYLAVIADDHGEVRYEPNPQHLGKALKQLRRACRKVSRRRGPDRRMGREPSRRWCEANAERNKLHHRVANLRENALHQLTTKVAREYGQVVVEDLNVAGMLKNRTLARHIADVGFGEIRRQLTYKTGWYSGLLHVVDRWYPSSKTCSGCGAVKAKLPLRIRTFECDRCSLRIDRDVNAARNLAAQAMASQGNLPGECTTGTGVAGDQGTPPSGRALKPRRADHKTRTTTAQLRVGTGGRAGGAIPRQRQEARDRQQNTTTPAPSPET